MLLYKLEYNNAYMIFFGRKYPGGEVTCNILLRTLQFTWELNHPCSIWTSIDLPTTHVAGQLNDYPISRTRKD